MRRLRSSQGLGCGKMISMLPALAIAFSLVAHQASATALEVVTEVDGQCCLDPRSSIAVPTASSASL